MSILSKLLVFTLNVVFFSSAFANQGEIKLRIKGFKSDKGQAMIALHNTKKTFLKKKAPFKAAKVKIEKNLAEYTFKDIPFGTYSIAVFHDENVNMDLDATFLGLPKEDYGFSNNAWRKFGPPKYKQTLFDLDSQSKAMEITVRSGIEKN